MLLSGGEVTVPLRPVVFIPGPVSVQEVALVTDQLIVQMLPGLIMRPFVLGFGGSPKRMDGDGHWLLLGERAEHVPSH